MTIVRMDPPAGRPQADVLVQMQDAEGFWNNVGEFTDKTAAVKFAAFWAREHRASVRVCLGPKRHILRTIEP